MVERIRELAIPPAWKDVWICPHPNGHIQATGIDDAGRKQYLYHPQWREDRDREKFVEMERVRAVAAAHARARRRTSARRGLVRERVLACAVRLLDLGFFRIGSERYAEENETFGLATLRASHVRIERGVGELRLHGQGRQGPPPGDRRPGARADDEGAQGPRRRRLRAARLPQRAQRLGDVKAERDQRVPEGGHGRRLQRQGLPNLERDRARRGRSGRQRRRGERRKSARKRAATAATKRVADYLSNTPAVCRKAYIDPRVFDRYDSGRDDPRLVAADGLRHRPGRVRRPRADRARRAAD